MEHNPEFTIDNFLQNTLSEELKIGILEKVKKEGKWEGQFTSPIQQNNVFFLSIFQIKGEQQQEDLYGATVRDISELKQKENDLHNLALFDGLTGLANRPNIIEKIRLACVSPDEDQFAVLFLDLDGFKQINDGYGHEIGDRLLAEVASRLNQVVKKSDLVARLGGDEFVIMAKNINDKNCLISMSQRILKAFESPLSCVDYKLQTTLSIGISLYPEDAENPIDLLKKADLAMYSSKQKGKNQFYFFNSAMELYLQERFSFEEDLKYGLLNNEFYQVFQPIIDTSSQKVIGCEALLRWNSSRRSMVSPASFIPMCESLNLVHLVDEFVFDKSIEVLNVLPPHLYYAINLPATHLYNTIMLENFLKQLSSVKNKKRIIFEITETSLIKDITRSIKIVKLIRNCGFSVAIDDFGTGYTSLHNIKMLDFDIIKLDRTFIRDLTTDSRSKSIVQAMVKLAHDMNMKIVAEGVEDKVTDEYLQSISCDCSQGFYHSKPLSLSDLQYFINHEINL
nr:EAL domain-containing protein [Alteromonas sp. 5E99-2]